MRDGPVPKKFKAQQSAEKVMTIIIWDFQEIVLIDYKSKGETITADLLIRILRSHKTRKVRNVVKGVFLLLDNVPIYKALLQNGAALKNSSIHHTLLT